MAEWIPIQTDLHSRIEVLQVARSLELRSEFVVGLLVRFWGWAVSETDDGVLRGASVELVELTLDAPKGFLQALRDAGWISIGTDSITVENYGNWLSKSGKARLKANQRKAKERAKKSPPKGDPPAEGSDSPPSSRHGQVTHPSRSKRDKNETTSQDRTSQNREEEERSLSEDKGKPSRAGKAPEAPSTGSGSPGDQGAEYGLDLTRDEQGRGLSTKLERKRRATLSGKVDPTHIGGSVPNLSRFDRDTPRETRHAPTVTKTAEGMTGKNSRKPKADAAEVAEILALYVDLVTDVGNPNSARGAVAHALREVETVEDLRQAVRNFAEESSKQKDRAFRVQAQNWFSQGKWRDYLPDVYIPITARSEGEKRNEKIKALRREGKLS